jgi:septal ring factor EnvC (AmiA/AmiB activator)
MAALEEVVRLRQEVDDLRRSLDRATAELTELRASIDEVSQGLQESRGQSLRVGQLTELVFARLADAGTATDSR